VFRIQSSIAVNAGITLTIQPGVVVKFDSGRALTVNGSLRPLGTVAQNVYFTSIKDDNVAATPMATATPPRRTRTTGSTSASRRES